MDNKATTAAAPAGQLQAADVIVSVLETDANGVRIKLWPDVQAVRRMLDNTSRVLGEDYSAKHYVCGRAMYCAVVLDSATRDAPCPADYQVNTDAALNEAEGSLVAAAAQWGIGSAVFSFPPLRIGKEGVQINPVAGRDGKTIHHYELADTLRVTDIQYGEDGSIAGIKLVRQDGRAITWQPKT